MDKEIGVIGAGAFGTALAFTQAARGRRTVMWGRDATRMAAMKASRENTQRLPGLPFPDLLLPTSDISSINAEIILLSVPTQSLRGFLQQFASSLTGRILIACCKGVEQSSGMLPTEVIDDVLPGTRTAVLTGPSFAVDIGQGRPTALTLATNLSCGEELQELLSTPSLRLYLSDDPVGAQLGGALKNVVALAAGMAIGAGLGESARAALMTRGFAEITRFAVTKGAHPETLMGLSGFGDLILTCSSEKSRNFSYGLGFAQGKTDTGGKTVEGVMTAHAVSQDESGVEIPVTRAVSAVLQQKIGISEAIEVLLSRPLREERSRVLNKARPV